MDARKINVLLIRKSLSAHSPLMDRLAKRGCKCRLATSYKEVDVLLNNHGFGLVLGPIRLNSDSLYPLIGRLEGSRTTLFFSQAVEEGCWWLPALRLGFNCFGAPAYRPGEFVPVLDKTIEEIRASMRIAVKSGPAMVSRRSGSVVNFPSSRRVPPTDSPRSAKSLSLATRKALG